MEMIIKYTKRGMEITHPTGVKVIETKEQIQARRQDLLNFKSLITNEITNTEEIITKIEKEVNNG